MHCTINQIAPGPRPPVSCERDVTSRHPLICPSSLTDSECGLSLYGKQIANTPDMLLTRRLQFAARCDNTHSMISHFFLCLILLSPISNLWFPDWEGGTEAGNTEGEMRVRVEGETSWELRIMTSTPSDRQTLEPKHGAH